jgi:hypothetical protein
LLADHAYKDLQTNKIIICGTFNTILQAGGRPVVMGVPPIPVQNMVAGSPWVYLSITEIHRSADLTLRYVDLEDHSVLLQLGIQVATESPLETVEMILPLPQLPVPHAGTYAVELCYGQGKELEPMGAYRIRIIRAEGETKPEGETEK